MVTSRIWFTVRQKAELWERWKNGQSVLAISRALERRNKTGVQRIVALHGGIAPAPRRRAVASLRLEEREDISRGIAAGRSIRGIARGLRRSPSGSRDSVGPLPPFCPRMATPICRPWKTHIRGGATDS